ncbi:hypothetical protein H8E88_19305 [candidate division KSB1 bacterium]|nr:hypothetical protein [candidate division KSB1 bacterium]
MCGLNLLINGNIGMMSEMMVDIAHRGIRGRVEEPLPGVLLGHRRLPIQGLDEKFDQPITKDELVMAFVGEIFNYKEFDIRAESDSTVLLQQYLMRRLDAFKTFDGFWAVVIVNTKTGDVDVITDYLAKKPLYIRTEGSMYGVSSEITPLLALGPVTPNKLYLSAVAKWGYDPSENTPYNEIQKIPANHCLRYNAHYPWDGFKGFKYDELKPNFETDLFTVLKESVKNRLISDVPVSLLLSGGLDSTIIFKLIKQFTTNFTIFHVDNNEEEYLSRLVIPEGVKVIHTASQLPDLKELIRINQTPVDLGSVAAQWQLGAAVANGFVVAISGDGADELFGGYRRAKQYDSQYSDIFHELIYYHLPRLDRMMMAHTVELRCPFLNRDVIEFAMSLNWSRRKEKNILKKVFGHLIPNKILHREKKPLKNKAILENKFEYRLKFLNAFIKEAYNEC